MWRYDLKEMMRFSDVEESLFSPSGLGISGDVPKSQHRSNTTPKRRSSASIKKAGWRIADGRSRNASTQELDVIMGDREMISASGFYVWIDHSPNSDHCQQSYWPDQFSLLIN